MRTRTTYQAMAIPVAVGLVVAGWLVVVPVVSADDSPAGNKAELLPLQHENFLGYEGIPSVGSSGFVSGPTPPVGDFVTTHCRYLNVQNTTVGHYFLRYPLHPPDGARLVYVSLYVADFNPTGVLWAYLRTRPWNSRIEGTTLGFTLTDNATSSDKQISLGALDITVDNQSNAYWVDVSPQNGLNPGQLCVYGIQVTYDCSNCPLFRDGFESGGVRVWSSAVGAPPR
jgi:hypothetical protein